jgi:flagellar M-ring protein FliF
MDQFIVLWNNLHPRARVVIVTAALLCLAGLSALSRLHTGVSYVPLYTGLAGSDAAGIVEKLKTEKVPYHLTQGGATIEVPQDKVYELRVLLAKDGLPSSGQVGFELFDRSNLPGTQFSNQVNYQRALQGELARTISAMDEVASARVHLVLPQESLFSEETKASASVVVQPKPGRLLAREQTAAIAHIVASAVRDVKAEEVTIVDSSGHVLFGMGRDGLSGGGLTSSQLAVQQEYEDRLCRSLQSMLDSVLGPNKSVVRVQTQLDFDREEVKNETLTPVGQGRGLLAEEKIKQEQYQGGGSNAGGAAGLKPNLGLGQAGGGGAQSGSYMHRDESRQYQYSRNQASLVKAPGKIKNLTVAAIVDESLASSAEGQVKQILSAAAGANERRGDVVTVQRMKIEAAELAKTQQDEMTTLEKGRQRQTLLQSVLRGGMSLAAAGLIFFTLLVFMRQLRQLPAMPALPAAPLGPAAPLAEPVEAALLSAPIGPLVQSPPVASAGQIALAREQLRQTAQTDVDSVADRLMHLIDESNGG